jgi:hypothetical protein
MSWKEQIRKAIPPESREDSTQRGHLLNEIERTVKDWGEGKDKEDMKALWKKGGESTEKIKMEVTYFHGMWSSSIPDDKNIDDGVGDFTIKFIYTPYPPKHTHRLIAQSKYSLGNPVYMSGKGGGRMLPTTEGYSTSIRDWGDHQLKDMPLIWLEKIYEELQEFVEDY